MDGALNELKFIVGLFREGPVLVLANKQDISGCLLTVTNKNEP